MRFTYAFFAGVIAMFVYDALADKFGFLIPDGGFYAYVMYTASWLVGLGIGYLVGSAADCFDARADYYRELTRRSKYIRDDEDF